MSVVSIRQYTSSDRDGVYALIRDVWGEEAARNAIDRWVWEYDQNPFLTQKEPRIDLMIKDEKIIGMACVFPARIKFGDVEKDVVWSQNFMVHPDYRGMAGLRLAKVIRNRGLPTVGYTAGETRKIWFRIMGEDNLAKVSDVYSYVNIIDGRQQLKRRFKNFLLVNLMNAGYQCWKGVLSFSRKRQSKDLRVEQVERFDDEVNSFWDRVKQGYSILSVRNKVYLNWRYVDFPLWKHEIFIARDQQHLRGYVVCYVCEKNGIRYLTVLDILTGADDTQAMGVLLEQVVRIARSKNVNIARCTMSPWQEKYIAALRQSGFIKKDELGLNAFFYEANWKSGSAREILSNEGSWFITRGDSDTDYA